VSWLVLQAGSLIFGALELPNALMKGLLALLAIGFIPTLVFSWIYEFTPEGLKRESEIDRSESITHLTGRKLDYLVIGVLVAVVGLLLVDKFVLAPRQAAERERVSESVSAADSSHPGRPKPAETDSDPLSASIAVLPFVDMSQTKDQEYFSDGLSEELLNLLAKIPELRVIARTSSFSFKGKEADIATIAKTLNVAHVLEGSVRKSGNVLRITAQLIRTVDSSHLWSETYDREVTDIFKVQDEIAAAVVSALKLKLLGGEAGGRQAHRPRTSRPTTSTCSASSRTTAPTSTAGSKSEAAYKQAVALDPDYAAAWAGLSRTQTIAFRFPRHRRADRRVKRQALASAEKAIALAPDSGDGYVARGRLRGTTLWDWRGAEPTSTGRWRSIPGRSDALRHRRANSGPPRAVPGGDAATRKLIESDPL
jgi:TolB-like protein